MSTRRPLALALAMTAVLPLTPAPLAATWREQVEADWLRQDDKRSAPAPGPVNREEDAAGAVDGVKDGHWGFHTDFEKDPWWQVDLGQPTKLDRVLIYNRCDAFSERTSRLLVLLSGDGQQFRQVYQHNGTVFYGATDGKPLTVKLGGIEARFLRLALADSTYFHLDEVEAYAVGGELNVALAKPATQSSVSQWSLKHTRPGITGPREYPIALVLARGLKLAESQRHLGANVDKQAVALRQAAGELRGLPADLRPLVIHTNYLVNLASTTPLFLKKSVEAFRGEIERALALRAEQLVLHPGSFRGADRVQGLMQTAAAIAAASQGLDLVKNNLTILIENTAGAEYSLGGRFEQVAEILDRLRGVVPIAACIDTCHTHVAGYDMVSEAGMADTLARLDATVGLKNVRVWHCNDAKAACGSKLDRHQHIGRGSIGLEPFRRLLNDSRLAHAAFIAETPIDAPGDDKKNVATLKRLVARKTPQR